MLLIGYKRIRIMPPLKNLKRERFCREIMSGKTRKQAYLDSYHKSSENSAEANGSRLIGMDSVRKRCLEIMESKTGLCIEDLLDKLKDLTIAEKDIVLRNELVKVSDNPVRLSALQTAFDLLGLRNKTDVNIDNRSINVSLQPQDINTLTSMIEALKGMRVRDDRISGAVD